MARIYTQSGDDGSTGLFLGGRVSKGDPLVDAYGDVDEAVALLGVARASTPDPHLAKGLLHLQRDLFVVAADMATNPGHRDRLTAGISLVTDSMIERVEKQIDVLVTERPLKPIFVIPGATPTGAAIDHARTVVRRAERHAVRAREHGASLSNDAMRYLNRLSDLLFVLARHAAGDVPESPSHE